MHQLGTILRRWQPFVCPPGVFCPVHVFELRPFDAVPRPVGVEPGKELAVALGFRLSACTAAEAVTPRAPSEMLVTFRLPGGASQRQIVPLGSARPLVRGVCGVR